MSFFLFSNTFFNFLLHICRGPKNLFTYLNSLIPFKITSYDVEVEYFEILLSLMEHFLQQNSGKY